VTTGEEILLFVPNRNAIPASKMDEPLGDKLFDITVTVLIVGWAVGWVLLLLGMLVEKLFPALELRTEQFLRTAGTLIEKTQKYALIAAAILLLIRLVAGWLGWAPPLGRD
jgi:hypothetical protein